MQSSLMAQVRFPPLTTCMVLLSTQLVANTPLWGGLSNGCPSPMCKRKVSWLILPAGHMKSCQRQRSYPAPCHGVQFDPSPWDGQNNTSWHKVNIFLSFWLSISDTSWLHFLMKYCQVCTQVVSSISIRESRIAGLSSFLDFTLGLSFTTDFFHGSLIPIHLSIPSLSLVLVLTCAWLSLNNWALLVRMWGVLGHRSSLCRTYLGLQTDSPSVLDKLSSRVTAA